MQHIPHYFTKTAQLAKAATQQLMTRGSQSSKTLTEYGKARGLRDLPRPPSRPNPRRRHNPSIMSGLASKIGLTIACVSGIWIPATLLCCVPWVQKQWVGSGAGTRSING